MYFRQRNSDKIAKQVNLIYVYLKGQPLYLIALFLS